MAGVKQPVTFQLPDDVLRMLDSAVEKHGLPDRDKALRCILDYVAQDGDWDQIFSEIRCLRCGGQPGWTGD